MATKFGQYILQQDPPWKTLEKFIVDQIKPVRDSKQFVVSTCPFTPPKLIREIFGKIPPISSGCFSTKIAVFYTVEMAIYLSGLGFDDITLVTRELDQRMADGANKFGYKYKLEKEIVGMKFDVVVGNPPYTQGSKPLYANFFDLALDIGNLVAFVFPVDLNSNNKKLRGVNTNIKKHSSFISEIISNQFTNVSQPNIRYVLASRHISNKVDEYVDPLQSRPVLYPARARIKSKRGSYAATVAKESTSGVRLIRGVLSTGVVEKIVDVDFRQFLSEPFVVLVNYSMSGGRLQCAAMENKDVMWSYTTFAIPANSEREASDLRDWLTSEEIGNEMADMMKIKNVYTFSGPMLDRLPSYK